MRRRATIALALLVVACATKRFSVTPYDTDGPEAKELGRSAAGDCLLMRADSKLPDRSFTSDGCSMWPDSVWVDCCVDHDVAYWCGGSAEDRNRADDVLQECVTEKSSGLVGSITWIGVKVGGVPWLPFPWRWGYGWSGIRGYEE